VTYLTSVLSVPALLADGEAGDNNGHADAYIENDENMPDEEEEEEGDNKYIEDNDNEEEDGVGIYDLHVEVKNP